MARIGFKKTFAAGTFDKLAAQTVFDHMKDYVIDAGFAILLDSPTAVDFIRLGSAPGTADDDIPHWALEYVDQGAYGKIMAYPVYGNHYLDAGAYTHPYTMVNSSWIGNPPGELTLWFAADSVAGWWWLHATEDDATSPTGLIMRFACAGTTSRRYPSDRYQGVCSRYGIWDPWGDWEQAYAIDATGAINVNPWTGTWSPFGEGWTNNGQRHPGSPLPKMAVPQFPNRDGDSTAVVLGEFNEIMILTDGYAQGEIVVPGWIAMRGDADEQPYAVPAPASFAVL